MIIRACFLFFAISLFTGGAYGFAEATLENPPKITPMATAKKLQKIKKMLKKNRNLDPNTLRLFEERTYHVLGGKYRGSILSYRLFSPKNIDPQKQYPLVLWLHCGNQCGSENVRQLLYLRYSMLAKQKEPFFILAPQNSSPGRRWDEERENLKEIPDDMLQLVLAITEKTIREKPIDPDRVSIFGHGNGGIAAQIAASRRPDLFSVIATCSTNILTDEEQLPLEKLAQVPVWAFHNLNDESVQKGTLRSSVKELRSLGGAAHLTSYPSSSHDSWTQALIEDDALAWLAAQKKGETPHWKSETFANILWFLKEAGARFSTLLVTIVLLALLWRSFRPQRNHAYA